MCRGSSELYTPKIHVSRVLLHNWRMLQFKLFLISKFDFKTRKRFNLSHGNSLCAMSREVCKISEDVGATCVATPTLGTTTASILFDPHVRPASHHTHVPIYRGSKVVRPSRMETVMFADPPFGTNGCANLKRGAQSADGTSWCIQSA